MDILAKGKYPSSALSNFAPHKFVFRGVECNSVEGLLQSLKYSNPEMQKYICTLVGFHAKKTGSKKNWRERQTLYWQGKEIDRQSGEYQELLDEIYQELFDQCDGARRALLATQNANLTHSIGKKKKSDTILTQQEFCSRLMKNRKRLQREQIISKLFDK